MTELLPLMYPSDNIRTGLKYETAQHMHQQILTDFHDENF